MIDNTHMHTKKTTTASKRPTAALSQLNKSYLLTCRVYTYLLQHFLQKQKDRGTLAQNWDTWHSGYYRATTETLPLFFEYTTSLDQLWYQSGHPRVGWSERQSWGSLQQMVQCPSSALVYTSGSTDNLLLQFLPSDLQLWFLIALKWRVVITIVMNKHTSYVSLRNNNHIWQWLFMGSPRS